MSSVQVELLKVGALQPTINALTAAVAASTTAAQAARTGAETAETNAETAETGAATARTGAETARTGAETALTSTQAAAAIATITPTADKVPRSLLHAPRLAPGWLDLGAMFFGQISEIPDFMPIPEGWWEWAAPASGLRKITNWTPEALRRGTRDVRDVTVDPLRLYSNLLGTTLIAGPSAEVAAIRDSRGVLVATQTTAAARLKYAVQPATGVRNRLAENMAATDVGWLVANEVGGAGVLTVVDDAAAIAALGLPSGVRAYRLDNSTGTAGSRLVTANPNGAFDSALPYNISAFLRRESGPAAGYTLRTGFGAFAGLTVTDTYARYSRASTDRVGGSTNAADTLWIEVPAGGVGLIVLPQREDGLVMTAPQAVRTSGFDVTEAGVRPVHQLVYDGQDDFMDLVTAWTSGAAYTLAAAHNLGDQSVFNNSTGVIFGNTSLVAGKFYRGSRTRINIQTDTDDQRSAETANVAGRVVDLVRMVSGGEAFYRNGVLSTLFPASEGDPELVFNTLGRSGTGYAVGGLSAALAVTDGDTPLEDAERQMIQKYLENKRGTVA